MQALEGKQKVPPEVHAALSDCTIIVTYQTGAVGKEVAKAR